LLLSRHQYLVEECLASGIEKIYIIIDNKSSLIRKYFTPNPKLSELLKRHEKTEALKKIEKIELLKRYLRFVEQCDPLGEAHAFLCARKHIDNEPVIVLLGDTIYCESVVPAVKQMMQMPRNHKLLILGDGRMILTPEALALFEKKYQAKAENIDLRIMDVFKPEEITFFNIDAARIELGSFEEYAGACARNIKIISKKK
jgi:UTP-glucose-1-phosphate uridylyltransferase